MKRFLLAGLLFFSLGAHANEITEDYFDIATNYCLNGNYRQAVIYLDKILMLEPENKSVTDLRNGLNQIIKGYNTSFIVSKSNAVKQAVEAKKNGDKQKELNSFLSGNDYWAYYFLGEYYKQNKDYSQAINYYIKSVNQKTTFTQCYLQIAICYYELKNYMQTITYINQYLKVNSKDDFAYALRAKAHLGLKVYDTALSDILTAIALENSLEYQYLEGKILFDMRRYEQAKNKLEKLTNEIHTSEIYKYIGFAQAELGNYNDAIINLEKSLILSDDDKTVITKYNEIKLRVGK
ncbi:MAG: hypothetical protein E7Z93_04090 [Cyanobacteria bacterium SIG32]|nr:hypothetical protein [Cyanobacteria bacterium SIG32]